MTKVTYDFSDLTGNAITGASVDQNFDDLTAAVDQITTANIAATAGITSTQLSDRYAISAWGPWTLLPVSATADFSSSVGPDTLSEDLIEVLKHKVLLKSGRRAYLIKAEFTCLTQGSAGAVEVLVTVGGTTLGIGAKEIDAPGYLSIQNTLPVETPLLPLNNDDEIIVKVGANQADVTAAGLSITFWIKEELVP